MQSSNQSIPEQTSQTQDPAELRRQVNLLKQSVRQSLEHLLAQKSPELLAVLQRIPPHQKLLININLEFQLQERKTS